MLSRAVNGFTQAQVDAVIRGDYGDPTYRARAELIDRDGAKIRDVTDALVLNQSKITHNSTATDIKRSAQLLFQEKTLELDSWLNVVLATSPLFFWRMADTTTTVADASGNGRTATLSGGYTQSVGSLNAGDTANASTTFNGTTGNATIADAAWMDVSTAFSLSAIIQGTDKSDYHEILNRDNGSTQRAWAFFTTITTGALGFTLFSGATAYEHFSSAVVMDGAPHHVMMVYNGSFVDLWVDGFRVLHAAETHSINNVATGIDAARKSGVNTFYFPGTLDELIMWDRALTSAEVRNLSQRSQNDFQQIKFDRDYIRIYGAYEMTSNGTDSTPWAEWATFTGKLSSPTRQAKETGIYRNCALSDLATLLKNDTFGSAWTVSAGENFITGTHGVLAIAQALFDTSTWAITTTVKTLPSAIEFPINTPRLDAINTLLEAINYRPFRFKGDGTGVIETYVLPADRAVEDTLNCDGTSIVVDEIEEVTDIDQTNNIIKVTRADPDTTTLVTTATNSDVTSATSTVVAGRANIITRQVPVVPDQTTLDNLGLRFLAASGLATKRLHFSTFPRPFHADDDKITLTDQIAENALGISVTGIIEEWTLPLDSSPMTLILRELDV